MASKRPHGTYSRYTADGCRCPECREATRLYCSQRNRLIAYDRWQPWADAEPSRQRVARCRRFGLSRDVIAGLLDISHSTVSELLYRDRDRIRSHVAERILSADLSLDRFPPLAHINAAGSQRRIQAMAVMGWSVPAQEARGGMKRNLLNVLGAQVVHARTAIKVRDLFCETWDRPPSEATGYERRSVTVTRAWAARNGWVPAMAWDDIDDPDAVPDLGEEVSRQAALAENADELIRGQGYTLERAAERLGISVQYLSRVRTRAARQQSEAVDA